jgi:hopene-associated glycosyltransferase HpnB
LFPQICTLLFGSQINLGAHSTIALIGWLPLAIWLYLLIGRGGFWRARLRWEQTQSAAARVIAVVPARNEAEAIGAAIRSLLAQSGVELRVVLVDDHSTDGTAAVAQEAAAWVGGEDRLTVIQGTPVPEGWTGKLWAAQQGIDAALALPPDFLLLTDADIEHSPESVASLVAIAEAGKYDLASYMVKLHCRTVPERLLIPAFVYFFFQLYPPKWISDPQSKMAGAAGGCMLIRPEALTRAGAMHSIRGEIIDDCALAREVKRTGGRLWLGLTESARSIRPYRTFGEIERMIARTAFNQLRHSVLLLIVAILGLLLTYIVPLALLTGPTWPFGAAACALMVASYWPMIRFYRLNPLWALTLPLAALFYMAATLDSAIRYWIGAGGQWKGRAQDRKAGTGA